MQKVSQTGGNSIFASRTVSIPGSKLQCVPLCLSYRLICMQIKIHKKQDVLRV